MENQASYMVGYLLFGVLGERSGMKQTLLIVDDEPGMVEMMKSYFADT